MTENKSPKCVFCNPDDRQTSYPSRGFFEYSCTYCGTYRITYDAHEYLKQKSIEKVVIKEIPNAIKQFRKQFSDLGYSAFVIATDECTKAKIGDMPVVRTDQIIKLATDFSREKSE